LFLNTAYLKKLHKNAAPKFAQAENPDAAEDAWKKKAAGAMKMILANWDNYDVLMGQSTDGEAMYVPISSLFPCNLKTDCF
jgi:hypothetical protein